MENIGLYTNPKHELYVASCDPSSIDIALGADDVLLRIRATGICGSDVHFWKDGCQGPQWVIRDEFILGHESSADIIKVGANVKSLSPGDRVAVEPGEQCLTCDQCLRGCYNGCPHLEFKSTPPFQGLLRRYVVHPGRLCHKLPNAVSYEEGALLEPISVGLSAITQSGLKIGDPTLVCGAGPIGIVSAILARAAGASPLIITDINQARLDVAAKLVPSIRTVNTNPSADPQQMAENIITAAGGKKVHVAIECTGFEQSIATAIYALDFGGTCEIIGAGKNVIQFPFGHVSVNELTVRGLLRYANTWPRGIRLIENGIISVKDLVTHRFPLEEGAEAFEVASDPKSGAIKVIIYNEN